MLRPVDTHMETPGYEAIVTLTRINFLDVQDIIAIASRRTFARLRSQDNLFLVTSSLRFCLQYMNLCQPNVVYIHCLKQHFIVIHKIKTYNAWL